MFGLKKGSFGLALAALGLAATHAQACNAPAKSEPKSPQASERRPLVASLAGPGGVALAGAAGLVAAGRVRKAWRASLVTQTPATPESATAAYDYPTSDEW